MSFLFRKIAIVGSGAIGTLYGSRLQEAGHEVHFLMRSDYEAVKQRGSIIVRENSGERVISPVLVHASSAEIGICDLVLITLKTTSNADLPGILGPLVAPGTPVVTLQNGFGSEEFLATFLPPESIMGGLCFVGVHRTGPGELKGFQTPGYITLGEFNRPPNERTRAVADCLSAAGIPTTVAESLAGARWEKLMWNIPYNGLSIAAGCIPTDQIMRDPVLVDEVRALMHEVVRAAAAEGYVIPEARIEARIAGTPKIGAYRPSSLVDHLAGRLVEVESIWAEPLRRARARGVDTPRLALLHALLRSICRH